MEIADLWGMMLLSLSFVLLIFIYGDWCDK